MNDAERDEIKRDFKQQLGIEVSDDDIDHATQAANEAVERKKVYVGLLPLRRHLWLHHYSGPTEFLDIKGLEAVHETAARQGSHPEGEL